MKVIEYSRAMGLDMIQGDHEDAPGQLELNFQFDDALRTADRLSTYRQICAQVGRENNLIACFMSKPFMGVSANGCHHNVSLWTGGKDEVNTLGNGNSLPGLKENFSYRKGGTNLFMPSGKDKQKPGPVGLKAIGGVMAHLDALTAIGCPTVNSLPPPVGYGLLGAGLRRLGLSEPYDRHACFGAGPVRVPRGRLDGESLSDGRGHHSRRSTTASPRNSMRANRKSGTFTRPWKRASRSRNCRCPSATHLKALDNDEVIKSAMPGDMYKVYKHYKTNEWETFMATVTEWDLETYWDCLP